MATAKAERAFVCILPVKTYRMGAPISQLMVGGGMSMWLQPFLWPDTIKLSSSERECEKWLTESTGVKYAQKRVKNFFSSEIVTVELLGDSGETTRRHLGSEGPSSDYQDPE